MFSNFQSLDQVRAPIAFAVHSAEFGSVYSTWTIPPSTADSMTRIMATVIQSLSSPTKTIIAQAATAPS